MNEFEVALPALLERIPRASEEEVDFMKKQAEEMDELDEEEDEKETPTDNPLLDEAIANLERDFKIRILRFNTKGSQAKRPRDGQSEVCGRN